MNLRYLGVAVAFAAGVLAVPARVTAGAGASRDACEAALDAEATGRATSSSRGPCHQAMLIDGMPRDYRNEVASLMSPVAHPTLDDMVLAGLLTDAALRKAPDQPWASLARCDIARRLGNADLMAGCLAEMKRLAPGGSQRAAGFVPPLAPVAMILLRLLLVLALGGTLVHALWRRRPGHRRAAPSLAAPPAIALAVGLAIGLLTAGDSARAEEMPKGDLSVFKINEADPESSVPTLQEQSERPLEYGYFLQDLAAKADKATKAGDHAAEARYYRALTKAAPGSAVGPRKLCAALEAAKDFKNAVVACRTALTRDGTTAGDYLRFVQVTLGQPGALPKEEHAELNAVLGHMERESSLGVLPEMFRCEIALRFSDRAQLAACTTELARRAPDDPKTVSFQWALALQDHDERAAKQFIERARELGMNAAALQKMQETTRAMMWRWLGRLAVALLALGLVCGGGLAAFRRAARARVAPVQLTSEP